VAYLEAIDWDRVLYVHLAGHTVREDGLRIDTHHGGVGRQLPLLGPPARGSAVGSNSAPRQEDPLIALREFQREWARSVGAGLRIEPNGAASAPIKDYSPSLLGEIPMHAGLDAAARLSAYRYQYWFRLFTTLQGDFPLLGHLIGWTRFNRLASKHLTTRRPGQDLSKLAQHFGRWILASHAPGTWKEAVTVDLAWLDVFAADSATEPTTEDLQSLETGDKVLVLQPSVVLLSLRRDWISLRMNLEGAASPSPGTPPRKRCRWGLSRKGFLIHAQPLEMGFMTLLDSLRSGMTWLEALETTTQRHPLSVEKLPRWFALGSGIGLWGIAPASTKTSTREDTKETK
jgi:Putative DNA-binding domain